MKNHRSVVGLAALARSADVIDLARLVEVPMFDDCGRERRR